jgi:uncharacterized membrane protein
MIVSSNNYVNVWNTINDIVDKFTNYLNHNLYLPTSQYLDTPSKLSNTISTHLLHHFNKSLIVYQSIDSILNNFPKNLKLLKDNATTPDEVAYCGLGILELNNSNDNILNMIKDYFKTHKMTLPKVIIVNNSIFLVAETMKQCRNIEEVLKAKLLIINNDYPKNYLSSEEQHFLINWDAEKYRNTL